MSTLVLTGTARRAVPRGARPRRWLAWSLAALLAAFLAVHVPAFVCLPLDADVSLWLAGIDPRRTGASLTEDELARLRDAIVENLEEGIALRGTQRDLFGVKGRARHDRHIVERSGQPCPRCQTIIEFTRIGGRRTYYCPGCQH